MSGPRYWMYESPGVLRRAVETYLRGEPITPMQVAAMRAYLRQWIMKGNWRGPEIEGLRARVDGLISREEIAAWLRDCPTELDPL